MATKAFTYNDASIKESLWDDIKGVDVVETYVTSNAERVSVTQKTHSWVVDPIAVESSQAGTVEGDDSTYVNSDPTLLSNYTQIIEKGFVVTASTENSSHAGFSSRKAREMTKKMQEWGNQFELSAVKGVAAAGNTTTGRTMKGIRNFAVSNVTTESSGTSLTSDKLNTYLGGAWGNGAKMDTLIVGSHVKNKINSFTMNNTKNVDAKEALLVGRVDIIDTSYGRVKVVLHHYVAAGEIIGYMSDYVMVGFLDEPHFEERAKTGYADKGVIVGEGTIQVCNELAVMLVTNLTGA